MKKINMSQSIKEYFNLQLIFIEQKNKQQKVNGPTVLVSRVTPKELVEHSQIPSAELLKREEGTCRELLQVSCRHFMFFDVSCFSLSCPLHTHLHTFPSLCSPSSPLDENRNLKIPLSASGHCWLSSTFWVDLIWLKTLLRFSSSLRG